MAIPQALLLPLEEHPADEDSKLPMETVSVSGRDLSLTKVTISALAGTSGRSVTVLAAVLQKTAVTAGLYCGLLSIIYFAWWQFCHWGCCRHLGSRRPHRGVCACPWDSTSNLSTSWVKPNRPLPPSLLTPLHQPRRLLVRLPPHR